MKPKLAGGLGLGSLEDKNWTLLAKWIWRFGEEEALWRKVIVSKYGEGEGGWALGKVPGYRVFGLWVNIFKVGDVSCDRWKVFSRGWDSRWVTEIVFCFLGG